MSEAEQEGCDPQFQPISSYALPKRVSSVDLGGFIVGQNRAKVLLHLRAVAE
jgi:hypothetical protein